MIVRKYGGSCLVNQQSIHSVASSIAQEQQQGQQSIVVVSALQGDTDQLDQLANPFLPHRLTPDNRREYDFILSSGEQLSAGLLSMAINRLGQPAKAYNALQLGLITDKSSHTITHIMQKKQLLSDIENGITPIITGFQAISSSGDIKTLGRNSSDLSAITIAHHLRAGECRLYKDVAGLYTSHPKLTQDPQRYKTIYINDAVTLSQRGARVIHTEAMQYLKRHFVPTKIVYVRDARQYTDITNIPGSTALDTRQRHKIIHHKTDIRTLYEQHWPTTAAI